MTAPLDPETLSRDTLTLTTDDGWKLHADVIAPPNPVAVAVLGHAMMMNRRRLDWPNEHGLATTLAQHGILTLNADLRGHGDSTPRAGREVDWSYDDIVFQDMPALIAAARKQVPDLPLVLIGHSLFGHVAAAYLGINPGAPVDAVVGLGANVWLEKLEPNRLRWWRKRLFTEVIGAIIAIFGYFPTRLLRQGTDDEARTYFEQIRTWVRSGRWTTLDERDYLAAMRDAEMPALNVVGGRDDFLCVPVNAENMWANWGGRFVQWVVDEGWGLDYVPGHIGIAMNPACRPVWHKIAGWILGTVDISAQSSEYDRTATGE